MDAMSLQATLSVSVPEYILSVIIGFLIIGEKKKLFMPVKFILTILLMTIVIYFTRNYLLGGLSALINMLADVLIIKFIYRIKFSKSIICVLFYCFILITCELLYLPPFLKILGYSLEDVFNNDFLRFQLTIPTRLVQLAILISLWNIDLIFFEIKKSKELRNLSILILLVMNFIESVFIFTYIKNIDKMMLFDVILNTIACISLVIMNVLLLKFMISYSEILKSKHQKELKELNNSIYVYKHKIEKITNGG